MLGLAFRPWRIRRRAQRSSGETIGDAPFDPGSDGGAFAVGPSASDPRKPPWKPSSSRPPSSPSARSATRRSCWRWCSPRASSRPLPIIAGIFVATLANHALAGYIGNLVRGVVPADVLRWLVALSFFAVALWALKPDTLDDGDAAAGVALGRVRRHRRRVLPGRDGRQDAGRDGRARGASSRRSPRWCSARRSAC